MCRLLYVLLSRRDTYANSVCFKPSRQQRSCNTGCGAKVSKGGGLQSTKQTVHMRIIQANLACWCRCCHLVALRAFSMVITLSRFSMLLMGTYLPGCAKLSLRDQSKKTFATTPWTGLRSWSLFSMNVAEVTCTSQEIRDHISFRDMI